MVKRKTFTLQSRDKMGARGSNCFSLLIWIGFFAGTVSAQNFSTAQTAPVQEAPVFSDAPDNWSSISLSEGVLQYSMAASSVPASLTSDSQGAEASTVPNACKLYSLSDFKHDMSDIAWEVGGVTAAMTAIGVRSWDWGSQKKFKMNSEGWFSSKTGSGGTDKLGHAFTAYALSNVFSEQLIHKGRSPSRAAISGALAAQAIMLYVEVFDGYSSDHGFSKEDLAMNMLGSAVSVLRTVYPTLKKTVDFRMEYRPSGYKGFRPFSDYAGQKFLVAYKLSGLEALKSSPLRFVELHGGYDGIGVNLSELLWPKRELPQEKWGAPYWGSLFLEHFQMPYTSMNTSEEGS